MRISGPSRVPGILAGVLLLAVTGSAAVIAQVKREVAVSARKHAFRISGSERAEIRVTQNDLVRVTLTSEDVPHSFALPDYRIEKRVEPGRDVTFEFRAEKAGRFDFFCSLTADRCREQGMTGVLIVSPPS